MSVYLVRVFPPALVSLLLVYYHTLIMKPWAHFALPLVVLLHFKRCVGALDRDDVTNAV